MDDNTEVLAQIYEAIGDVERWRRVTERLADAPKHRPDIERHLEIARLAHERHLMLTAAIETLSAVQDQLALAALLVDRDRRILRANATATRLLADGDGLVAAAQCVHATDADAEVHLGGAIQHAASGRRRALETPFIVVRRPGRQPLAILVLSAAVTALDALDGHLPVALIVIDPEMLAAPGPDALRQVFGLTAREAEFTAMMLQGASVKEAARALGVTVATARSFLAQVAAKTDCHSQAELVRQLLAIPRIVMPDTGKGV